MAVSRQTPCIAFEGTRRIAAGVLADVAVQTKSVADRGGWDPVLIFHGRTGELIELDFRGTADDVLGRIPEEEDGTAVVPAARGQEARGPGRPRLGVVAREVTLLPRHWDWLATQPGGASVALRKLVEEARRKGDGKDRLRQAQEAAYRFLSAMAGNLPGFEEATRALFAGNRDRFHESSDPWPADVREHARKMADAAFEGAAGPA